MMSMAAALPGLCWLVLDAILNYVASSFFDFRTCSCVAL